jgi:hypothetical protein
MTGLCVTKDNPADQPESDSNMELWEKLRRVDPKHSKEFQRAGGFRGTAIKPSVQERLMTEVFGPIGFGWGMTKPEYHHITAGDEMLVYCTVGVWYRFKGEKSDIFWGEGGDKVCTVRKNGDISVDDEARKKSLTDAIGNALKRIGMAADIHMGLWDDSKYRDENLKFFTAKTNPDLQPPAIEKSEADLKEKLDAIQDLDALDDLWKSGLNARIREIGTADKDAQQRMISAFSQKKNEILKRDQDADGHRPTIQEEADREQAKFTAETAASDVMPGRTDNDAIDWSVPFTGEMTAERMLSFELWSKKQLDGVLTQKQFVALWMKADKHLARIEEVNKPTHDRIKGFYAAHQEKIRTAKTQTTDRKILGRDTPPAQTH